MNGFKVINEILSKESIKAATFARKIGITPTQIYDLQKGKIKGVSSDIADKIIEVYPHYDKSWIMTGLGNPLKESPSDGLSAAKSEINADSAKMWEELVKSLTDNKLNMLNASIPLNDEGDIPQEYVEKIAFLYIESKKETDYWRNKAQDLEYKLAKMEMS